MSKFYSKRKLKHLMNYTFIISKEAEKEIIKSCEEIIKAFQHFEDIREKDKELGLFQWDNYDEIFAKQKKAIQGILELYNLQKEELHDKDQYIDGLHHDLQEAIKEIDKLRGDK